MHGDVPYCVSDVGGRWEEGVVNFLVIVTTCWLPSDFYKGGAGVGESRDDDFLKKVSILEIDDVFCLKYRSEKKSCIWKIDFF